MLNNSNPTPSPLNSSNNGLHFDLFENLLRSNLFEMPIRQADADYFPEFIAAKLNTYADGFKREVVDKIDGSYNYSQKAAPMFVLNIIKVLSDGIINSVYSYYNGNVSAAIEAFNIALDEIQFLDIANISTIEPGSNFYRARISDKRSLTRPELFHNPYENRHLVTTARYSIPGFPALYLGHSVFAAWRELGEPSLNSLFLSRLSNKVPLKVVQTLTALQALQSSYAHPHNVHGNPISSHESYRTNNILKFMATYPLSIARSIRIKQNGTFKPEYIIPQLFLQYIVSKNTESDTLIGIMYPSTKFDFIVPIHSLSYNYVFPVKEIAKTGYCSTLLNAFDITQPTSIDIEELVNHTRINLTSTEQSGMIELVNGEYINYNQTKFSYIENIINSKPLHSII